MSHPEIVMNEIVREFLLETHENLAQLDLDLVTLEKDPAERETLSRVFRTMHTMKGTAGFLGLPKLQAVGHGCENLLSRLRAGELLFDAELANGLLAGVDAVRRMLAEIESSGSEGNDDHAALLQTLEKLKARVKSAGSPPAPPTVPEPAPSLVSKSIVTERDDGPRAAAVSDSALRVDVGLLDKLMTLVGELVLARNQIVQFGSSQEDAGFLGTVQRLNLLTTELQANVLKTRLQPIANVWSKFPRVVRDLAAACNKQATLDMEGRETELDKTIIEAIRDPLTHLVRNAVDHGIELPAERIKRGKPAEGRLTLHASHEGGKVMIEIADDGAGIDPRRVRDKAVQQKLITSEQAARLDDNEALNLIFLPGFSTTDKVTQFSGRGVGMDVVRTNIEKIGGAVAIESRVGLGTTVKMKIPLTLAIIPALTVTSAGDRYAIPQVSLLELVRLEAGQGQRGIEHVHGAPVYRLRGDLLPLVYLARELQVEETSAPDGDVNIVVLQADERQFGLVVDAIHDTEEIVVKPLQKQLKGSNAFAGATIMGDGKVALILDVLGLAQRAHVIAGVRERALVEKAAAPETPDERQAVLLLATDDGRRLGIPLAQVARLEEFPRTSLERVGATDVVQYRDEILPLFDIARLLRARARPRKGVRSRKRPRPFFASAPPEQSDTVQVVVFAGKTQRVGLVVHRIIDIVEESLATRAPANVPGVLFTTVIQGRVTEFLDVESVLRSADPDSFDQPTVNTVGV